jgi:5-methyltetrahydrofolate--homocysteine methyltransferase
LSQNTSFNVSAHPNAGLPNAFGEYDETPAEMQSQIKTYLDDNLVNHWWLLRNNARTYQIDC